jgi:hypothetical protein
MPAVQGRLYSKTIVLQGDPTSAPVNSGGPIPTQLVVTPVQSLPWRSTALTRIGDPNAAPVNTSGPVPSEIVVSSAVTAWRLPTVVTRIGDPNSAPAVTAGTPAPIVVQPAVQPQARPAVLLAASSADIYISGPVVATPLPQRPQAPPAIIVRQLQDGAVAPASPPASPTVVATGPQSPIRPQIIVWQQAQDGAAIPAGGPAPITLVVARPPASWWPPEILSLVAAPPPAPFVATPPPVIVPAQPAPLQKPQIITWQQLQDGAVAPASGPVPATLIVTRAQPSQPAPRVLTISPASQAALVAPLIVQAPSAARRTPGVTLITQAAQAPAVVLPAGPAPIIVTRALRAAGRPYVITARTVAAVITRPPVKFEPIPAGHITGPRTGSPVAGAAGNIDSGGVVT